MNSTIALYVLGCLHGTLHGAPQEVCRDIPIRGHDSIEACTVAAPREVADWLAGMRRVGIDTFVSAAGGWRCAPAHTRDEP